MAILAVVSPEAFRPYVVGAGVASVLWYVVVIVVVMAGTGSYLLGSYGEQWTSDALRKLSRHGWRLIEHVPLQYGDIDHVLLGPGGAYAIETKNSSRRWDLADPDRRLMEAIDQARGCANRLRKLLLEHSVRIRTDVRPLVVLWGTASATQSTFDGVQVVHGSALSEWKDSLGVRAH
ncbi:MAG TPA: nuclease-related domain-containing protein [Acidimicrobiales bacterium]|nr:nuclease-related domain-containing protein [Acidimicrobiales bacterium]